MTACRALQALQLFNLELSNFQPLRLSSSKLGGLSTFPSRRIFKPSNFANFQSFEFSNSRIFNLSKPSNSQTRDFSHKPQIESEALTFQNSKLSKLSKFCRRTFRKCKLSKSQTLKLRRPIELDRGKSLKFEFEAGSRARKFES